MSNIPPSIIKLIQENKPNITELNLSNRGLDDDDMSELHELLRNHQYINSLNLSNNNITDVGCGFLILIPNLTKVNLSRCSIGDKGVDHLVKSKIVDLNVSCCNIKQEGAENLLKHIDKYNMLVVIDNPDIAPQTLEQLMKKFVIDPSVSITPMFDVGLNIFTAHDHSPSTSTNTEETQGSDKQISKAITAQLNECEKLFKEFKTTTESMGDQLGKLNAEDTQKIISDIQRLTETLNKTKEKLKPGSVFNLIKSH